MKITIQQSGGAVGFAQPPISVETASLPPGDRATIEGLIGSTDFFRLPEVLGKPAGGGDSPEHSIDVQTGAQQHSVRVPLGAVPMLDQLVHAVRVANNRTA